MMEEDKTLPQRPCVPVTNQQDGDSVKGSLRLYNILFKVFDSNSR